MLVGAYMKCYQTKTDRDEYIVIPKKCPLRKVYCCGGNQHIGDEKIEFVVTTECEYYDNDSFKSYDNQIECNFGEVFR